MNHMNRLVFLLIMLLALNANTAQADWYSYIGDFETPGNFEGWIPHNVDSSSVNSGSLFIDPSGSDPYIEKDISVPASDWHIVETRMSVVSSSPGQEKAAIYFKTNINNFYSDAKKIEFDVNQGNGVWDTYRINMVQNQYWAGTITGIRIDPMVSGLSSSNLDTSGWDTIRLVRDTTPPTPDDLNPDDGVTGWSSSNTPYFTWFIPDDELGVSGYKYNIDNGPWVDTIYPYVWLPAQSDGIHTFVVKAIDNVGNIGYFGGSHEFKIDTVSPTISISSPTNGQIISTSSITVSGSAYDNVALSKVEVKVGSGSWQLASGTTSWSKSITLASGSNTIYARATDAAGNTNQASVSGIIYDPTNPTISISSPTNGQTVSTSSITVNGIANDNIALSKVEVKVGSGSWQLASGTISWSKSVTLVSGSNTIYARATDTSGRTTDTSVTVTYDPTNPTISISSPTNGQTVSTSSITVNGIANDNIALSKVEVKVGSGSWQLASGTTSWSKSVTLVSGSNTIYARATDTSGNTMEASVTVMTADTPVYISDVSADAGATVSIPVMITGAPSIGSFDVVITYDPSVLGSPSVSDGTLTTGVASGTGTSGQVSLAYASISGFSGTGSIAVIDFTVIGSVGDTSNLAFMTATATEPTSPFAPVTLTTTNAVFTVSGTPTDTPVYIEDISADAGATVSIPVMITGAPSIGSFDVVITYDPSVLGSPSVSDGTLTTGVASGTGTSGQVSLAYASISGFSGTGSIAVIDFTVIGSVGDTSNLAFTTATATEPTSPFAPVTLTTTDGVFTVFSSGSNGITGVITNQTGLPIEGVIVKLTDYPQYNSTTSSDGRYIINNVPEGTHNLIATKDPVYYPNSVVVNVVLGNIVVYDIGLVEKQTGMISGNVMKAL